MPERLIYGRVKNVQFHTKPTDLDHVNQLLTDFFSDAPHFKNRGGPFRLKNYQEFLEHLAGAVGAIPGSRLSLSPSRDIDGTPILEVSVTHPNSFSAFRAFTRDHQGRLILHNISQDGTSVKGTGYRRTLGAMNSLRKLGVHRVETTAAGNKHWLVGSPSRQLSGYIAWPRMGFDGEIPEGVFAKLPQNIRDHMGSSRSLAKLHSIPGGKESWQEYGSTVDVHFLPHDELFVRRILDYVKDRRRREQTRSTSSKTYRRSVQCRHRLSRNLSTLVKLSRIKNVRFRFLNDSGVKSKELLQRLFENAPHFKHRGGPLHPDNRQEFLEHFAALVGAIPGSRVTVTPNLYTNRGPEVTVLVEHENGYKARRSITLKTNGTLEMYNDYQNARHLRGTGYIRALRSINAARKLGVQNIKFIAYGSKDTLNSRFDQYSGYIAWPRMGFDGEIAPEIFSKLPDHVQQQMGSDRTLSKLHSIPGGKEAWQEYGDSTLVRFYPYDHNYVGRLLSYVKDRRRRRQSGTQSSQSKS